MIYSRIFYHVILTTYKRQPFIDARLEPIMYRAVREALKRRGSKLCYINGTQDHMHILMNLCASDTVSEVVEELRNLTQHIAKSNEPGFLWQEGYAVLSVSHHHYKGLLHYIREQKIRHARGTTRREHEMPLLDTA